MNPSLRGVGGPFAVALALLVAGLGCAGQDRVLIERSGTRVLEVDVRLAVDENARREGLRGMPELGRDEGLLIQFPAASEVCIVNDGVRFPIDAVYAEGGVVSALELAVPAGDPSPRCHRADEVLELNAGRASDVQVGDTLRLL